MAELLRRAWRAGLAQELLQAEENQKAATAIVSPQRPLLNLDAPNSAVEAAEHEPQLIVKPRECLVPVSSYDGADDMVEGSDWNLVETNREKKARRASHSIEEQMGLEEPDIESAQLPNGLPHCACPIELEEELESIGAASLSELSIGALPFMRVHHGAAYHGAAAEVDLFQQAATSAAAALNASELIYDVVEQVLDSATASPGSSPELRGGSVSPEACNNELAFMAMPSLFPSSVLGNMGEKELAGNSDWQDTPWGAQTLSGSPEQRLASLTAPAEFPGVICRVAVMVCDWCGVVGPEIQEVTTESSVDFELWNDATDSVCTASELQHTRNLMISESRLVRTLLWRYAELSGLAHWVMFGCRQARYTRAVFSEKQRESFSVERLYQLREAGEPIGSYLISIFNTLGNITYMGCGMTILEHALQCATVAEAEGGDFEEVQSISARFAGMLSAVC